jgi:cyclic beta-1,2-glucan synthetase
MYRVGLEDILGVRRVGSFLRFLPRIPSTWPLVRVRYRFGSSRYSITFKYATGPCEGALTVLIDGQSIPDCLVALVDDGQDHDVEVVMNPIASDPNE